MEAHEPAKKQLHVAMFPWLAFGHMIPFLELAKLIALKGHKVSYISTKRNIDRLPKIPPKLAPNIDFVSLALPQTDEHNLPEKAEATMDVPYNKVPFLKKAYDGLEPSVAHFLESSAPDWIVYDFAPYWLPPIASRLGVSRAFFSIFNAWTYSVLEPSVPEINARYKPRTEPEHFTVPADWVPFPSNVSFRKYDVNNKLFDHYQVNESGISDTSRFASVLTGSDVIAIRSCPELEARWLSLLSELHGTPVVPVGLLPPSIHVSIDDEVDDMHNAGRSLQEQWLDNKERGSVVYVALGSEVTPSQDEFTELALGLELSGLPFFWALRKRNGSASGDSVELPVGFEERTRDRGVVWTSWAPQLKILGHDSVGGFLTHCGWSSIIEGLYFEQPLMMLPFVVDQGLNSRVLEEMGVGIEIPRNEEDGSFTRKTVAETVKRVMASEERNVVKDEAMKMSKIIGDKSIHVQYVDNFVDYLCSHGTPCGP